MTESSIETPGAGAAPDAPEHDEEHFIPAWLVALVVVLIIGVVALGGYALRGTIAGENSGLTVEAGDVAAWEKAVAGDPANLDARVRLGYAYQVDGRHKKALEQYDHVLRLDPSDTGALYNRAVVLKMLGREAEAETAFWDVLEVRPDHALAAKALGEFYADARQYESVLRAVRPVVEAHPEMADLQYLAGLAYEETGDQDRALVHFKLALTYVPDMVEARRGLERLGGTP